MPSDIKISASVGRVAAVLTTSEFVLAAITAVFVRISIRSISLVRLHCGGRVKVDLRSRSKAKVIKDFVALVLGAWLAITVAIVESNLSDAFQLSSSTVASDACVRMDAALPSTLLFTVLPPRYVRVGEWALTVATQLNCGSRGLTSINAKAEFDDQGKSVNLSAPQCLPEGSSTEGKPTFGVDINMLHVAEGFYSMEFPHTSFYEILPYNISGIRISDISEAEKPFDVNVTSRKGHSRDGLHLETGNVFGERSDEINHTAGRQEDATSVVCTKRGISPFQTFRRRRWVTNSIDADDLRFFEHEKLCVAHGEQSVRVLSDETVSSCVLDRRWVNVTCVRNVANDSGKDFIFSVEIPNVALLLGGKEATDSSYACPDVTARLHYTFISASMLKSGAKTEGLPTLLPLRVETVSGHCERVVHVLGRAALLHSAAIEWSSGELMRLDRLSRFHALELTLAASTLGERVRALIPRDSSKTCELRKIDVVTVIAKDWRLVFLLIAVGVCSTVMVYGLVSRLWFTGYAWSVGSLTWTFGKVMEENGRDPNEVIGVQVKCTELLRANGDLRKEAYELYEISK